MTDPLELLAGGPYALPQAQKSARLVPLLRSLCAHHYERCPEYARIVDRVFGGRAALDFARVEDMPFLPVSLFKETKLSSIADADVARVLTSSGTTGAAKSRVYLDAETSRRQSAALVKIVQHFLGKDRLPMVVFDHAGVVSATGDMSARGAGILGLMQFGRKPFFALDADLRLDVEGLRRYVADAGGKPMFAFGFTFMIWLGLVREMERAGATIDMSNATLLHSGGWKKLADEAVDAATFTARVRAASGIARVANFYGMAEQVGGVFFEDGLGHLHAAATSEVIVRDPRTLRPLPAGERGLVQVVSVLPTSYPGHSLLTEDVGVLRGDDLPGAGMNGRSFDVLGRVPAAEVRGCSDTLVAPGSVRA